jgi:uncharacterized protein YlzI (FlbEa/FlbD family)
MANIISALKKYLSDDRTVYNNLIRKEAQIGGRLFGVIPSNVSRSFFCLDEYTWVYHEDTTLRDGTVNSSIIRYEIQPDRIVKVINGNRYLLSDREKTNFHKAVHSYQKHVFSELNYN